MRRDRVQLDRQRAALHERLADQRNFCRERVTESDAAYLEGAARGMRILAAQFGLKESSHWAEASLHARATADRFATYADLLRDMMRP